MRRILLLLCVFWSIQGLQADMRIMFIGDSITEGQESSTGQGFRPLIRGYLRDVGYPVRMVGPRGGDLVHAHYKAGGIATDFYRGPGGYANTYDVAPSLDNYQPDIVVVHLGTNDIEQDLPIAPYYEWSRSNLNASSASGRLAYLLAYIAKWSSGERGNSVRRIFVCKVIPKPGRSEAIDAINTQLASIVNDANSGKIPAIPPGVLEMIDQNTSFYTGSMLSPDLLHPNDAGYSHMAEVFLYGLSTIPIYMVPYSDQNVLGMTGRVLDHPLQVKIIDRYRNLESGIPVRFVVTRGKAEILNAPVYTEQGIASAIVQIGVDTQVTIEAHCGMLADSVVTFNISAERGLAITGYVHYGLDGPPVPAAEFMWREQAMNVGETDGNGRFTFNGYRTGDKVTLVPNLDARVSEEIFSYDAALTARAAVGIEAFDEVSARFADVDRDDQITLRDAALVARCAVGYDALNSDYTGQWRFYPDSLVFEQLETNVTDLLWTGRIMGDMDLSWRDGHLSKTAWAPVKSVCHQQGRTVSLTVTPDVEALLAMDGEIVCPGASECRVTGPQEGRAGQLLLRQQEPGRWKFGWYDLQHQSQAAFAIELTLSEGGSAGEVLLENIRVNDLPAMTQAHAYESVLPASFRLGPNFPNPFNGRTIVPLELHEQAEVSWAIYDIRGRLVYENHAGILTAGHHTLAWEGVDGSGNALPSGTYLLVLQAGSATKHIKMQFIQ